MFLLVNFTHTAEKEKLVGSSVDIVNRSVLILHN